MMRLMMRLSRKAGISCARVHELVQAYLDGELEDGPERDLLVAHLELCRPCGVEAETYERIKASLAPDAPRQSIDRLTRFAASIPDQPDIVGGADSAGSSGMSDELGPGPVIERLIGVYNAEGTLRGELTYWVGARLGQAHCSLCDITHGLVRERSDWRECRDGLPVPFETYHLDDQPDAVRALLDGRSPAVVADTDGGLVFLLHGDEIEQCQGSPDELARALTEAADRTGLRWATGE